jgi:hypothetical protein
VNRKAEWKRRHANLERQVKAAENRERNAACDLAIELGVNGNEPALHTLGQIADELEHQGNAHLAAAQAIRRLIVGGYEATGTRPEGT